MLNSSHQKRDIEWPVGITYSDQKGTNKLVCKWHIVICGACLWALVIFVQVDFQNAKAYWRGTIAALRLGFEHPRRQEASELLRQGLRMAYDGGTALPQLSPGIIGVRATKKTRENFQIW